MKINLHQIYENENANDTNPKRKIFNRSSKRDLKNNIISANPIHSENFLNYFKNKYTSNTQNQNLQKSGGEKTRNMKQRYLIESNMSATAPLPSPPIQRWHLDRLADRPSPDHRITKKEKEKEKQCHDVPTFWQR